MGNGRYDSVFAFAAMLNVICEEFEELKPIALIIVEKNIKESNGHGEFLSRWW
jgi:hypothetical protein